MKLTLDHNCIIDILNGQSVGKKIQIIIKSGAYDCYVVNIVTRIFGTPYSIKGNYVRCPPEFSRSDSFRSIP